MKRISMALALIALSVTAAIGPHISAAPKEWTVNTAGSEQPLPSALLVNGWVVANWGEARALDTYLRYELFLGEPISPWDGKQQTFRNARLVYTPGNPPDWRIEFASLGRADMEIEGYMPKTGSVPHPAVRDWLQIHHEAGMDTTRLTGRLISEAICDGRTRRCIQWTEKARFEFPGDATSGEQVQRQPLGLWMAYPSARSIRGQGSSSWPELPQLLAVGAPLVLLFVLLLRGRPSADGSPLTV